MSLLSAIGILIGFTAIFVSTIVFVMWKDREKTRRYWRGESNDI